mgnify:CR=1 FL=1
MEHDGKGYFPALGPAVVEDIYRGGNSKSRNPRMQTMLRMVGFGDNAGSGFPAILATWKNAGWIEPVLEEDTRLNQVTLTLKMISKSQEVQGNSNWIKPAIHLRRVLFTRLLVLLDRGKQRR